MNAPRARTYTQRDIFVKIYINLILTNPVESYLKELAQIRSSGAAVDEISYYPALSNLFNEIGKQLTPKVTCVMNIANQGAGLPDGGFFTINQLQNIGKEDPLLNILPSRGAIEVKGTKENILEIAESEQVSKYLSKYNQVLITNLRDFLLLKTEQGKKKYYEPFSFFKNERVFWASTTTPRKTSKKMGDLLVNYLKRAMLHSIPLSNPEDVAWFLASYAREAKKRLAEINLPALLGLRDALEESLGITFEGKKGESFFRSTLIQALFYGLFSSWVLWSKQKERSDKKFQWKQAAWSLDFPMIRELFELISSPSTLGPLKIYEVLDWTEDVLNRVDKKGFFDKFEEIHAIQYFYEPFLKAFDPDLRKELGVWYTPNEIVDYMVDRVDNVLKESLNIKRGLADDRVYILDPACGTGSYLLGILRRVAQNLQSEVGDALIASDLKQAATNRIFGFEILLAPFVVSHLQIRLMLQKYGVHFSEDRKERIGVYLTNSLTGWDLPEGPQKRLFFPGFEKERVESDSVKREKPILVVLGNPPYNAFAGVSSEQEQGLVDVYKEGLISSWGIKKFNLDDLYIRFFRLAERRIAEQTGKGVICFITNFSYLEDPSFVVMRKRLIDEFDEIWIDCMNGSSRETGKRTPDGKPDPSVFSTKTNPEGIRVGTTISLLIRKPKRDKNILHYRNFWGVNKRQELLSSLKNEPFGKSYQIVKPLEEYRYSFRPIYAPEKYLLWPSLIDICDFAPYNGPIERRGGSLITHKANKQQFSILEEYFDPKKTHAEIKIIEPRLLTSSGEFNAEKTRNSLIRKKMKFNPKKIQEYPYKPMDNRLAYLDADIQPLFSRPSPDLLKQQDIPNNAFFISRDSSDKYPEGPPFFYSSLVCDYDFLSGHARHFPLFIKKITKDKGQTTLFGEKNDDSRDYFANLSENARKYLHSLSLNNIDDDVKSAELIWLHLLAVGYSPDYLKENSDGIRVGWPRIPFPRIKKTFFSSVKLGRKLADLLDLKKQVEGITVGEIRQELKNIALITRVSGGYLDPNLGDIEINVGWGHGQKVVMPGSGKAIERGYEKDELKDIQNGARELNMSYDDTLNLIGDTTYDIYLNEIAYWKNIPARVWDYTIGGYQVIKKWLSYRDIKVLKRSITSMEVREVTNISKRISCILLLEPSLNENYKLIKEDTYQW